MFSFLSSNLLTNTMDTGKNAMRFFHEAMKSNYNSYNLSFDEMLVRVSGSEKSVQFFLDGFGNAIEEIQKDNFLMGSKVEDAMTKLAKRSGGLIPNRNSFFSALSSEAQNFTFIEAAPEVIKGTVVEIGKGAQAVGDAVITTGKWLTYLFPLLAIGGLLYVFTAKIKKAAK